MPPATSHDDHRLARHSLWLMIAVIVYLSLYPFAFFPDLDVTSRLLLIPRRVGRGDLVANILLYVPLGYCACFAFGADRRWTWLWVIPCGCALSLAIEVLQAFELRRVSSSTDVGFNTLGTAIGTVAARLTGPVLSWTRVGVPGVARTPLLLLGLWAAARLSPFVPSLDVQQLKDALKPLIYGPAPDAVQVVYYASLWAVVANVLADLPVRAHPVMRLAVSAAVLTTARLMVDGKQILPAEVAGVVLAMALTAWGPSRRRPVVPLALLTAGILIDGLRPFDFADRHGFVATPFRAFITGSLEATVQAVLLKLFFGATFAWLLVRAGASLAATLATGAALFLLVEVTQMWLPGRVSEITDVVLFVGMAALVDALEQGRLEPTPAVDALTARPTT